MCETKTILVSISLFLLASTSSCIYQAHTGNKFAHHKKIKNFCPCENEYKQFCLNGGECYYLIDERFVGCNCTWLYGGKRREKYI